MTTNTNHVTPCPTCGSLTQSATGEGTCSFEPAGAVVVTDDATSKLTEQQVRAVEFHAGGGMCSCDYAPEIRALCASWRQQRLDLAAANRRAEEAEAELRATSEMLAAAQRDTECDLRTIDELLAHKRERDAARAERDAAVARAEVYDDSEVVELRAQAGCLQSACDAYREAAALANARAAREEQAYLAVCHDLDNANADLARCREALRGLLIPLNDTALRPETALMAIRDQVAAALEVNE